MRSSFFMSRGSTQSSGLKPLSSAATWHGISRPTASKRVIRATPLFPARRAAHDDSTSFPQGLTVPSPVTTTRRRIETALLLLLAVRLDIGDGVPDRLDLLGFLVGDAQVEFVLELHHQLDGVEAV